MEALRQAGPVAVEAASAAVKPAQMKYVKWLKDDEGNHGSLGYWRILGAENNQRVH